MTSYPINIYENVIIQHYLYIQGINYLHSKIYYKWLNKQKSQLTVLNTSLIKTATQKISSDIISTFYRMNGETVRLQQ